VGVESICKDDVTGSRGYNFLWWDHKVVSTGGHYSISWGGWKCNWYSL